MNQISGLVDSVNSAVSLWFFLCRLWMQGDMGELGFLHAYILITLYFSSLNMSPGPALVFAILVPTLEAFGVCNNMLAETLSWFFLLSCPLPELTLSGQAWVPGWEEVDSGCHRAGVGTSGDFLGDQSSLPTAHPTSFLS